MKILAQFIAASILLLFAPRSLLAQFNGGSGDGHDDIRAIQLSLDGIPAGVRPLYAGGRGDGFDRATGSRFISGQSASVLFSGGQGDGFDFSPGSVTLGGQSLAILYGGGGGDGFDGSVLGSQALSGFDLGVVYGGGSGDGFDRAAGNFGLEGQSLAAVFGGGSGDGFDALAFNGVLTGEMFMLYGGGPGDGFDVRAGSVTLSGFDLANLYGGGAGDGFDVGEFAGVVPLPLNLIHFDAFPEDDFVLVKWITEDEVDTDFFTIEKTRDGREFSFVGETLAAGWTEPGEQLHYQMRDDEPFSGTSFYRLRTTDFDGAISLSHLVEVQFSAEAEWDFTLFPNPNTGRHFSVRPEGLERNENLRLEIIDAQGRLLRTEDVPAAGGSSHRFDLERRLPAGSYLIRATARDGKIRAKVLLVGG